MTPHRGLFAVHGSPVLHSLSPAIHGAAFAARGIDAVYGRADVGVGDCARALRAARLTGHAGLSVTTPLKEEMARCMDSLSDLAGHLGAVNCVTITEGSARGDNTDGEGCCDALEASGTALRGARIALLGAGGTARSVAAAAAGRGAAVVVINRTASRAAATVEATLRWMPGADVVAGDPGDARECGIVVNATSVGFGDPSSIALDPEHLHVGHTVLDAVYSPLRTGLLVAADRLGASTVDGLWMLVHQAVRQQHLWHAPAPGDPAGAELARVMRDAAERELARRPR